MYEQTDFFLTSISVLSMESCPNVPFTTRLMMQLYQYLYIVMGLNGSATYVSLISQDGFSQFYRASKNYTHGSRFVVFCCELIFVYFTPMPRDYFTDMNDCSNPIASIKGISYFHV